MASLATAVSPGPGAHSHEAALSLRYFTVVSADGTRLQGWTNDADGPTVLLCNGLGTNPYVWPALLEPDCGVRVISWNHRGVGGSERPADRDRVGVTTFVEDALAVLDHEEVDACAVMGWSIGVNTMYELAVGHPERVTGLFAVAGVPGDTFASMGAPILIPRPLRKPIGVSTAWLLQKTGWLTSPVASRLPVGERVACAMTHSGFMLPAEDLAPVARAVKEFLTTPVDWYMHLALHASRHLRVSLRSIDVPAMFVAGTYDILASSEDMRTAAERIPDATYVELPGTHFLPLERSTAVHDLLLQFLGRLA